MQPIIRLNFAIASCLALAACSSGPSVTRTGFLSRYDSLEPVDSDRLRFVSSQLRHYTQVIIDPVAILPGDDGLERREREEIAAYCGDAFRMVVRERGLLVAGAPGPRTARLRIAITSIQDATWWKKLHPASNAMGAGRGGAAMEAEIVDSVTGEQVAAVIRSGVGSQFRAFNISTVSDVKNTIDVWARDAGHQLDSIQVRR